MSKHVGPVGLPIDGSGAGDARGLDLPGPQPRHGRAALGASPTPGRRTSHDAVEAAVAARSTRRPGAPTPTARSRPLRRLPAGAGRRAADRAGRAARDRDRGAGRAAGGPRRRPARRDAQPVRPTAGPEGHRRHHPGDVADRGRARRDRAARSSPAAPSCSSPRPRRPRAAIELGRIALDFLPRGVLNVVDHPRRRRRDRAHPRPPRRRGVLHRLRGRRRAGPGRRRPGRQARPPRRRRAADASGPADDADLEAVVSRGGRHASPPTPDRPAGSRPASSCRRTATTRRCEAAIDAMADVAVGDPHRPRHPVRAAALGRRARPGAAATSTWRGPRAATSPSAVSRSTGPGGGSPRPSSAASRPARGWCAKRSSARC